MRGEKFVPQFPEEEPANALCDELGERELGEFSWSPSGQPEELEDPVLSQTRLLMLKDHTFRIVKLRTDHFFLPTYSVKEGIDCEGIWRVASRDGSFLYYLVVNAINGKPTNHPLLFRPGDNLSILTTIDNRTIEQFMRRPEPTAKP